jgi:putative Holliday junction resolvase
MPERSVPGPAKATRTVLAFDFGRRRIGVAIGQEGIDTAGPLPALRGDCPGPEWRAIADLIVTWQPQVLLVGRPLALDGTTTWMTRLASAFARELSRRFALPVELVDETLTSRDARSQLAEQRRSGQRRRRVARADLDSIAAQLMLCGWLDERAAAQRRARLG